MATFVLVHGAMHGGWCWREVRRRLCAGGHEVYAPTLTGQGDRRQALTAEVGIATHVTDLTDLLWFSDLRGVHLVLHSYSGVLAGPVAEQAAGRLASVTYLAAFLAQPGQSLADAEPPETAARYRALAASAGDGWLVPASERFLDQWGVASPELRALIGPRLTGFPLRCLTDPVEFDPRPLAEVRQAYVIHTQPPLAGLRASYEHALAAGWETRAMPFSHDLMLAAPAETAALLDAIGSADGPAS